MVRDTIGADTGGGANRHGKSRRMTAPWQHAESQQIYGEAMEPRHGNASLNSVTMRYRWAPRSVGRRHNLAHRAKRREEGHLLGFHSATGPADPSRLKRVKHLSIKRRNARQPFVWIKGLHGPLHETRAAELLRGGNGLGLRAQVRIGTSHLR